MPRDHFESEATVLDNRRQEYIGDLLTHTIAVARTELWDTGRFTPAAESEVDLTRSRDKYLNAASSDLDFIVVRPKKIRTMLVDEATARLELVVEGLGKQGFTDYAFHGFTKRERREIIQEQINMYPNGKTVGFHVARECLRVELAPEEQALAVFVDNELHIAGQWEL